MKARCNGSFPEKRKKRYVCLKYGSPCAPVLLPWLGEVQGTSLAMTRARLCQSQHIYSCSGWLRCSDGGRRQRCRWVSDGDFRRTPCTQFFSIHVPASQPHSLPPTECGCEVGPRTEKNWVHGIRRNVCASVIFGFGHICNSCRCNEPLPPAPCPRPSARCGPAEII